jgi:hypothetical protein
MVIQQMRQIRPNIFRVSYSELGRPEEKGPVEVGNFGTVILDIADIRYIQEQLALGLEPIFFVSRSAAMGNQFVVISRNRAA